MSSTKQILFLAAVAFFITPNSARQTLTSPLVTNWGTWGAWQHCPTGTNRYVTGFQLKVQGWLGPQADDTALNGIRFYCGKRGDGANTATSITSAVGNWGDWKTKYNCNGDGYAIGFTLRALEAGQANIDETAAQNLRLLCHSSTTGFIEGDGEGWGEWTTPRICGANEYMCGIRTQVEAPQGILNDDTALNNLSIECCDL